MNKLPPHKIIDVSKWIRKGSFDHFIKFPNACYGFNSKIDITGIYNYSKKTKTSIFINLLYVLVLSLNEVEEMRLRYIDNKVICYDVIHPAYTIMVEDGQFENASNKFNKDYKLFYKNASEKINDAKNVKNRKSFDNDSKYLDEFYITCVPWLELEGMTHPFNSNDKSDQSVPRICWDKFHIDPKTKKVTMNLNISVSHLLVDGKHLCDAFNNFQKNLNNYKKLLK